MTVSDLIFWEDYTINSNGVQIPISKSSIDISIESVDEVMAQYADEIAAAGLTEEQVAQIAEAIKAGGEMPEKVLEVMAAVGVFTDGSLLINTATTQTSEAVK